MVHATVTQIDIAPRGHHADGPDAAVITATPQDRALYACPCGTGFQADVTASVRCPGCGAEQAW